MASSRLTAVLVIFFLRSSQLTLARAEEKKVAVATANEAVITTVYDIRDLIAKPAVLALGGPTFRNAEPAQKAAHVVRVLLSAIELYKPTPADHQTIEVLNGTHLVIRATAARHAHIAAALGSLRRIGDVAVSIQTQLHEVDDGFYTKLKNAKPIDLEELERQFLAGIPLKGESFFKLLKNHKMIQSGEKIKVSSGEDAALLSRHQAVSCLPGPEEFGKGAKDRQTFLEGVSFLAEIKVSSDRRSVRVKFTEKSTELQQIKKLKRMVDNADKEMDFEIPFLKKATHSRMLEIPDGGSILVPVHYRSRSVLEKERWWVLSITARIIIVEEERAIFQGLLPELVADILKNPRLKTTREFYGSPGDQRFAVVNSDAWTWPAKFDTPGHQTVPADRKGIRLLGIRIDKIHWPEEENDNYSITVTLVNAGGSTNGAVVGGCTVRYTARHMEKGVELSEPPAP